MKTKILASNKETQSIKDKPKTELLNKELLTAKDAAFILGCSTKAVHLMIRSGRLKAINLGLRKTRVSRSVILALFDLPELAV
ncbi:helix-turn-helix domain-containing protein [Dyadobacter sp. 3J3]|uniref:helix-turn-helix domain-containing protein n=1 Tax=Dyadobacter sp. 3J3 TaxID=2606600 RepID=UPI00190F8942|nr:helix-turn-helix domain-containing protein [Dyadobacter sp. 3J3]